METVDGLDVVENDLLYQNVSNCVVNLIAGLARVVAEQDSMNDATNEILPISSHMLLKYVGKTLQKFCKNKKIVC